ncbi:MFS transporter [Nonomuraea sp. NPDC050783]|uniref:MFS transporter n=1 Tax=Nonomuraea sp. NPDC050783 TaxID=3154634 RepID=UPI0034661B91
MEGQVKVRQRARIPAGWRVVVALAVTQTVGWGVLYYAFAVFLNPLQRDLHASAGQVTGAFTLAVLITGVAAPVVGRLLDRYGGRGLMTAGSVVGTLAMLAWSRVESLPALYAVLAAVGVASALALYEPAFAVVVAWFDPDRRANALLAVTLMAGFASTIFMPLTALFVERYGWRTASVLLAVIFGLTTIPLHAFFVRRPARPAGEPAGERAEESAEESGGDGGDGGGLDQVTLRQALRGRAFWLLAVAFVAHSAAIAIMAVHLLAYLVELGHPPTFAAAVTGLLGVLSVTGRLVATGLQRRHRAATVTAVVFAVQAVAVAVLPPVGASTVGAIACVIAFGIGFGVGTIARPLLIAERYGAPAYATIAGALALPTILAKALGPLGAAVLSQAVGYPAVMLVVCACSIVASALLVAYARS